MWGALVEPRRQVGAGACKLGSCLAGYPVAAPDAGLRPAPVSSGSVGRAEFLWMHPLLDFLMACLLSVVDTVPILWLCVLPHATHVSREAGRLTS